jgi:hypothetical protein
VWTQRLNWVYDVPTANGDGIASPGERVSPRISIKNDGAGVSKNVVLTLATTDADITVVTSQVIYATWEGGFGQVVAGFLIDVSSTAEDHDVSARVTLTATNGGDGATFDIVIPISTTDPPSFSRLSEWIFEGALGNGDGKVGPGERVEPRIRLLNGGAVGSNVSVALSLGESSGSTFVNSTTAVDLWGAGKAQIVRGFVLDIDPAATVGSQLPITVTITADNYVGSVFTFTVLIDSPAVEFTHTNDWVYARAWGNGDADPNPGERVAPRFRLQNIGTGDGENVVVSLSTSDADITVVTGQVTHATWVAGTGNNNNGFLIDIAEDAIAHEVTLVFDVTADNASPAQFSTTFSIVELPLLFRQASSWTRDRDSGNFNGRVDPGERVELRTRLVNHGPASGRNVVVTLSTSDPDITVVTATETHSTWAAGDIRNSSGLLFDVNANASAHDATLTVTVTADNGGPWSFTATVPIVAATADFISQSFWSRDRDIGTFDALMSPGERLEVRARIKSVNTVDGVNVVGTLTSTDGKATIDVGEVTQATWAAGTGGNLVGFVVVVDADASGSAAFRLSVDADNGGPWVFSFSLPITVVPAEFIGLQAWARDVNTGDGDGLIEAGETVQIRAGIKNTGQVAAENVTVTLSTLDSNVTVVTPTLNYATWAGGLVRGNNTLAVTLGSGVGPSIEFTVDVTADVGGPWQFMYTVATSVVVTAPASLASPADIDLDGSVDIKDIVTVATVYGEPATAYPTADVNGDAVLDIGDMMIVHHARTDVVAAAPRGRQSRANLVEGWLRESRRSDDGSEVFQKGVPALERLLAFLRPAVTAVLQNYPNPFNPETWIPFDLADAGEVTIRVYNVAGQVVRRLDLGYVEPGQYRSRDAAAYWDGRNEFGEAVASGVYVYEIRSGGDRDMRRMVVRK